MRQDAYIQAQVENRIQELAQMSKAGNLKSQRGGKVDVIVKHRVKWPHEYVLTGINKERISYDQLNVTQWVAGFGRTIREESDAEMQKHMINYMIALMDDANDFSWPAAKSSHAVLLCRMEQGKIRDFSDLDAIERIRRANAQRFLPSQQNHTQTFQNSKRSARTTKSMPCTYYNQDNCTHAKSHETRGVLYRHICTSCFAGSGKTFPHSETECKNKQRFSKNE